MSTPYTTVGGVNYRGNVPTPSGVFTPNKYPVAPGKNYQTFGEQKGWVYDPYNDIYRPDPKAQHDLQVSQGLVTDPPKPPGLLGTVAPVAGALGAVTLGKEGGKYIAGLFHTPTAAEKLAEAQAQQGLNAIQGTQATQGAQALGATTPTAQGGTGMFLGNGSNAAAQAPVPTYPGLEGGPPLVNGQQAPAGMLSQLGNAGKFNPLSSQFGSGATNPFSSTDMGQNVVPGLQVVGGTYAAIDALSKKPSVGGFAEGEIGAFTAGSAFGVGPEAAVVYAAIYGGKMLFNAFFHHVTTRESMQKHTDQLKETAPDDPTYQAYIDEARKGFDAPPPDPTRPFGDTQGNTFATFQEYKAHGLDPYNLTNVYGNINTFGPDWAHYTPSQRVAVTNALIQANLYNTKKGEVIITDPEKAKTIAADVIKNNTPPPPPPAVLPPATKGQTSPQPNPGVAPAPDSAMPPNVRPLPVNPNTPNTPVPTPGQTADMGVNPQPGAQPVAIKRTMTLSPGIGLDGKPLSYGMMRR